MIFILSLLVSSFIFAQYAADKNSNHNDVFRMELVNFNTILGYWEAEGIDHDLKIDVLEFSKTKMKARVKFKNREIPIYSKVWISKIVNEYKTSFDVTDEKIGGRYTLFVNPTQPNLIQGYYENSKKIKVQIKFIR